MAEAISRPLPTRREVTTPMPRPGDGAAVTPSSANCEVISRCSANLTVCRFVKIDRGAGTETQTPSSPSSPRRCVQHRFNHTQPSACVQQRKRSHQPHAALHHTHQRVRLRLVCRPALPPAVLLLRPHPQPPLSTAAEQPRPDSISIFPLCRRVLTAMA